MYSSHSTDQCRIFAQVAPVTILQSISVTSTIDGHWFGFILFRSTHIYWDYVCNQCWAPRLQRWRRNGPRPFWSHWWVEESASKRCHDRMRFLSLQCDNSRERGQQRGCGSTEKGPRVCGRLLKWHKVQGFTQKKEKVEFTSWRRQKKHVQSRKAHPDKGSEMPCSRNFWNSLEIQE